MSQINKFLNKKGRPIGPPTFPPDNFRDQPTREKFLGFICGGKSIPLNAKNPPVSVLYSNALPDPKVLSPLPATILCIAGCPQAPLSCATVTAPLSSIAPKKTTIVSLPAETITHPPLVVEMTMQSRYHVYDVVSIFTL